MRIERRFTRAGQDPFEGIEFAMRDSRITNPDGSVVFEMADAEIPASWSQVATDIMVSKYFRKAGVPITMHCDRCMREAGCHRCNIASMREKGLLGPDVQIVHAVHAAPADIEAMAETRTHLSLSPQTELRTMGFPKVAEMLAAGVLVTLSIDTTATPCNADMFSQMRVTLSTEMARVEKAGLTPRRMLQMATVDGARDLGLADKTGSITPGKRADLILVRMNDLNMVPCSDPVDVLVLSGLPQNVDTVIADGRILKRGGKLIAVDVEQIAAETRDSVTRMLQVAGREAPPALRAS